MTRDPVRVPPEQLGLAAVPALASAASGASSSAVVVVQLA